MNEISNGSPSCHHFNGMFSEKALDLVCDAHTNIDQKFMNDHFKGLELEKQIPIKERGFFAARQYRRDLRLLTAEIHRKKITEGHEQRFL